MSGGSHTCAFCMRRGLARGDTGATAVEFALLFPLFLVICFGTISGGILFSDKLAITQGAREAARYGATLPNSATDPTAFLTKVREAAVTSDYGQLGSGTPSYCVAFRSPAGVDKHMLATDTTAQPGPCPGTSGLPARSHVLVVVTKPATLNMLLYRFDLAVGSTSLARYEGAA